MYTIDAQKLLKRCRSLAKRGCEILEHQELSGKDVHNLRVLTKKLRAAWGFFDLSASINCKPRRAALKEASGHLSAARDQAVLHDLGKKYMSRPRKPGATEISPEHLLRLKVIFQAELECWKLIKPSQCTSESLVQELQGSYRDCRRYAEEAYEQDNPQAFHEWRKANKRLQYQSELLGKVSDLETKKIISQTQKLSLLLGEQNDLQNLRDTNKPKDLKSKTINKRTKKLKEKAKKVKKGLLIEDPDDFLDKL